MDGSRTEIGVNFTTKTVVQHVHVGVSKSQEPRRLMPSQVEARHTLEYMQTMFIGTVGEVQARGTTEARLADEAPLPFLLSLDLGGR